METDDGSCFCFCRTFELLLLFDDGDRIITAKRKAARKIANKIFRNIAFVSKLATGKN